MTIVQNPFSEEQLADLAASDSYAGLPAGTSEAQIMRESGNNANAVSPKGAIGYAQVMPKTLASLQQQLGRKLDPTNWQDSITIQRTLMKQNMDHFGNPADALAAYNGGWDRSKWNNTETLAYVAALAGGASVSSDGSGVQFKQPAGAAGMTSIDKELALRAGAADIEAQGAATANATASERPDLDTSLYGQIDNETAAQVASETQHSGMGETFVQGFMWNTITGRMLDHMTQEAPDANYRWDQPKLAALQQAHPEVYNNDEMREYVTGAGSDTQAQQRLAEAVQHLDWQRRYSNTTGLAGAGDFLAAQLGAMADPVTLAATMGLGAGVAAIRGGAEAAMLTRLAGSAAEGAAVNEALGKGIADMDNHEFGWKDVVNQGVAGAALGAIMGLIPHKAKAAGAAEDTGLKDLHEGATQTANDVINDATAREATANKGLGKEEGVLDPHSTDNEKIVTSEEAQSKEARDAQEKIAQEERVEQAEKEAKADTGQSPEEAEVKAEQAEKVAVERDVAGGAEEKVKDEEQVPEWSRNSGNRNERPSSKYLSKDQRDAILRGETPQSTALEQLTRIAKSEDQHEAALANRLLDTITDTGAKVVHNAGEGRAHYDPNTHTIHLFETHGGKPETDRTTLHEIAHSVSSMKLSYGKEHPSTAHGDLYKQFDSLRQYAKRKYTQALTAGAKPDHEIAYYLKNADEFLAGLFSKHVPFLEHLRGVKVKNANLLSKTLDVLRGILGLRSDEANGLTKAMGLADQIIDSRLKTRRVYENSAHLDVLTRPGDEARSDIPLGPLAQTIEKQLTALRDVGDPKELAAMRERGLRWYSNWRGKTGLGKAIGFLDSVGLKLATSENEMVRSVANMLCEDATGLNRRGGTSAAIDKAVLAANWRTPLVNIWHELSPKLMTARERAEVMAGGGDKVMKRIGKQVQEERLRNRAARQGGHEYVSQAPDEIKRLAAAMDGLFKDMSEKGTAVGEDTLTRVNKSGWQGYMPYRFDDSALRQLYRDAATDPARAEEWNSLKSNFVTQYVDKLTEPMRKKMSNAGPVEERKLLERVTAMAQKRTDDYFTQIMRTQGDRVLGADDHFANVAASMLDDVRALNGNKATRLTKELIKNFRKDLAGVISDKSRTEFDLLRDVRGVRMLDYMDTDFGRMVEQNTSHYAGAIALAKRGVKDEAHWTALKDVLARHGASDEELSNLDFVHKSLTDAHSIKDNAAASALQSATALAMMGKVGLNGLGDAGSLVGAVGVGGFFKAFAGSFSKDSGLMKQLRTSATSALGLDHRLKFHDTSEGVQPHAGSMLAHPMYRNVVHGLGTALSWMSLSRPVAIAAHRAAVPAITEELVKAIRGATFGEDGHIVKTGSSTLTPARLVDTGLTHDRVKAIQELLNTHDAGRKEGDALNWSEWDKTNPGYAEDFIGSIHRVTSQVIQRAYIGEQPRWQTETQIGRFISQFRQQGIIGAEKQFARNMSHADRVTMQQFAFNTAWAASLYWAKTEASTAGMSSTQASEYRKKHYSGEQLAAGIAAMTNISGIASDALDATNVVFGGQSNGSSPFAALGYLHNVASAANKVGKQVRGTPDADIHKTVASVFKTLPLSNTFIGTGLVNGIQQ